MPARIFVRPPARPSAGAMALRRAIGENARLSRRNPVPRQYRIIINWGNSSELQFRNPRARVLNLPEQVGTAANKLAALRIMQLGGVNIPEFCTNLSEVSGMWMARTKLTGHSGDGIVVLRDGDEVVEAPLYTRYIKKREEYRLHVVDGKGVIFVQQKRKQAEREQTADERLIRSHDNGWVYCVEGVEATEAMQEQAIKAVEALGLDFGAVDMVIERDTGIPYVLEVNTAPGLASPTLLAAYVQALTYY